MLRVIVRLGIVLVLVFFSSIGQSAQASKILKRGNGGEPYSVDPHRAIMTAENNIIGDMLMGLYTEDSSGRPILGAAESVETSADGLTWTFKIRRHSWSDGSPVTADDFVFAFRRVLARETAAEYASVLYPIRHALDYNKGSVTKEKLGVAAPDPSTLVITLEHPAPFLPELLTHYTTFPVPKAVVEKYGSEWTRADKMVVNGPYKLTEWRPHDHILLTKNPKFFDAANVKVDQVYFYPTDDDNGALKRFRAGEIDTQERWPISEFKWLNKHFPKETKRTEQLAIYFISFNLKRKPFDDLRVRKAIAMSIDGKALTENIFQDVYGKMADNFIPPGTANADRTAKLAWIGLSMNERRAEAKKLLAAAGYGPAKPLKFTYRFISVPDIKRGAIALQAMWREAGIDVELQASEAKVHWNLLEVHDFDVAYNTWQFDYNDAKNLLFTFQVASEQMNSSSYASPEFERILTDADKEPDALARAKLLGQANAQLLKDLPSVPLIFPYQRHLVKSYVLNWKDNARDINRTRWVDIGDRSVSEQLPPSAEEDAGGIVEWIASWFSADAWAQWWNG